MSTAMQRASMRGEQMTARPALPPDPQPTTDRPAGDAAVRRAYAGSERLHEGERRVLCGVQKKQFGELFVRALLGDACAWARGASPTLAPAPRLFVANGSRSRRLDSRALDAFVALIATGVAG